MSYGGYGREQDMRQMAKPSGLDYAQFGLGVAGTALQGFGAYQAYQQAERDRKEEQRRFEEQKRMDAEERRKQDEERRQSRIMGFGQYAQNMDDQRRQAYGGYAARVGL